VGPHAATDLAMLHNERLWLFGRALEVPQDGVLDLSALVRTMRLPVSSWTCSGWACSGSISQNITVAPVSTMLLPLG
jgi:hypothetical protein